ncbi:MAG: hypothetical protein RJA70_1258 [Pseudomonadota bacterium]
MTFESEETGFRVIQVQVPKKGIQTCVGRFPFVPSGSAVSLSGEYVQDKKHGSQFKVHSLVLIEPDSLLGIEKYLGSGLIPGIGPIFAKRIVEQFGLDTLKVLDESPERLKEVVGLGAKRRAEVQTRWREQRALGNLTILLQKHGVGGRLAGRILERFAERAAEIVQNYPYRLALEIRGVGFKTADRIAQSQGISKTDPERAQAGTVHQLRTLVDQGHVFVQREVLCQGTAAMLEVDSGYVDAAIDQLWAKERVVVEGDAVYPAELYQAEVGLAAHAARLVRHPAPGLSAALAAIESFEKAGGLTLAPNQRQAVEATAQHKLVIITGGPGVGKTTIVKAILRVFEHAKLTTLLAAPTGRAAKRLAEATGRSASTIHRLLEYDASRRDFSKNVDNPIAAQAVIIDEASMVDLQLAHSLFSALPDPARLVIVGDTDQLPSVGAGAVLRDLIESGVACVVRLNEIFRQSGQSTIVTNAHRIQRGEMPESSEGRAELEDFFIIERTGGEQAAETILELVLRRIPRRFDLDPLRDIQVLCPMHRGPAGTLALNHRLQQALNPSGPSIRRAETTYRAGDRVMQLRNDYDREVFNGDTGIVVSVNEEARSLLVNFDEREVTIEEAALEQLGLAYAVSIHKSQGSEYPAIVLPFLTSHFVMLSRNLLYTAVTRARRLCVLVADPKAIALALSEVRKGERSTSLERRLRATGSSALPAPL